ncbi:MAG TPA: hypothetical protein VFP15_06285 [Gemmatimonadaceae bacterium]|nr:hypothetical protein [Gemmatimonadaceae bacterium]
MARSRAKTLTMLAASSLMLAACAGEATAPVAPTLRTQERTSPFVPTDAQRALVGVVDGTYQFTVDPSQSQTLQLGASGLYIPANAICDLGTSSYGMGTWNDTCAPQTAPMTITAVVRNAGTDHPSVEFQPALRFSPDKQVWLYLAVTDQATLDATKVLYYCNETSCMDESQTDADLKSYVDTKNFMVFRRIKHFSGYVVAEFSADPLSLDASIGF